MHLELLIGSRLETHQEHSVTIAPTRTRPLYGLSHRAQSLGDGEVEDLVESLSTSSGLAESWAVPQLQRWSARWDYRRNGL